MFPVSSFVNQCLTICDCKPVSIPSIALNFLTNPNSSSIKLESSSHIKPHTGVMLKISFQVFEIIDQKSKYIGFKLDPIIA